MATPAPNRTEADTVLTVCENFFKSFSSKPPLTETLDYVFPDGFCTVSDDDGRRGRTFSELVKHASARIGKIYESGAKTYEQALFNPGPNIWVRDNIAAVVSGHVVRIDDVDKFSGVSAFSLLKTDDNEWKITGLVDTAWSTGAAPLPISPEVTDEIMAPVNGILRGLKEQDWDAMSAVLHQGCGATLSRRPQPPFILDWPEFLNRLKVAAGTLPPGTVIDEQIYDVEGRWCGNIALVWAPFIIELNGKLQSKGQNIFTLLESDGQWFVTGIQDTHIPLDEATGVQG